MVSKRSLFVFVSSFFLLAIVGRQLYRTEELTESTARVFSKPDNEKPVPAETRESFMQKVAQRAQAMYAAVRATPVVVIEAPSLSMSTITVAHKAGSGMNASGDGERAVSAALPKVVTKVDAGGSTAGRAVASEMTLRQTHGATTLGANRAPPSPPPQTTTTTSKLEPLAQTNRQTTTSAPPRPATLAAALGAPASHVTVQPDGSTFAGVPSTSDAPFYGLFRCDTGGRCPAYAAAFLTTKEQLIGRTISDQQVNDAKTNMESASYHTFGRADVSAIWTTVDALDFSVEHISMYERVLGSVKMVDSPLKRQAIGEFDKQLQKNELKLRTECTAARESPIRPPFANQTVAVMPFYGGLGSGHSIRQTKLRYLNITTHSLHCHFDAVVVAVSDPQDRAYILEQSGLPIFDVIVHGADGIPELPKPSAMGICTIRELQNRFQTNPRWAHFKYLFYTEADQILHMRTTRVFAPLLTDNPEAQKRNVGGKNVAKKLLAVVTPHRFHNVPRASEFGALDAIYRNSTFVKTLATKSRPQVALAELVESEGADPNLLEFYPPKADGPTVRREIDYYESMKMTRFEGVEEPGAHCCFAEPQGLDNKLEPNYGARRQFINDGVTEMFAIGDGLSMVAGDCCFICIWRNRYCHNTCQPRRPSQGDGGADEYCAKGAFSNGV